MGSCCSNIIDLGCFDVKFECNGSISLPFEFTDSTFFIYSIKYYNNKITNTAVPISGLLQPIPNKYLNENAIQTITINDFDGVLVVNGITIIKGQCFKIKTNYSL